jgi:hypothetical protein
VQNLSPTLKVSKISNHGLHWAPQKVAFVSQ